jgi:hypothetical protein
MPDRPELVVQALRLVSGEEYDTYYGYYFDHPTNAWKFYAAGNKWHRGKPNQHLRLGSFCEVPGPPHAQRTGDIRREVRRRGWAFDGGKWVPLEQYRPGGRGSSGDPPVNKSWHTTKDGEYAMTCGGIRFYKHDPSLVRPADVGELPYFLKSPTVENLFTLPIEIGKIQTTEIASDRAAIEIDIPAGGDLRDGAVFFGTKDALTFAPRKLHGTERNSELSKAVNEMSWQRVAEIPEARQGVNRVVLDDLEPETTYFYRVLMTNSISRIWNDETKTFITPKQDAAPIRLAPLVPAANSQQPTPAMASTKAITGEPFRHWTYSVGGETRTLEGRLTGIAGDKIQIERKSDGKKGTMNLEIFSTEDKKYVLALRR